MKKYLNVKNGIITVLIILLVLSLLNPYGVLPNRVSTSIRIDSIPYAVHDTVMVDSAYEVEVPVEVLTPYEVKVPTYIAVDTAGILKMYYVKIPYKDVITLPNNVGTLTLIDTISQNKIVGRSFESKIKKQIVRDTLRLPEEKKNKVYFGLNAQIDRPNLVNGLGMGLLYQTKEDKIFKVGIGVNNWVKDGVNGTFTPYVDAGIYWKIKVRR